MSSRQQESQLPHLVLASSNIKKLEELRYLLQPYAQLSSVSQFTKDIPAETGLTFIENALIKARAAAQVSGLAAVADDSGLIVPALKGEPGLYSARYAGENASDQDNITAVMQAMRAIGLNEAPAYYHATLVLVRWPEDPDPIIAQGRWHAKLRCLPQGTEGFGYDPIFYVGPDFKVTAAQLTAEVKHEMSHRGKALRSLIAELEQMSFSNSIGN